jgi:1-(5-phosphoribosyl)-5-[(5-phosphoribosylamino)methylideneamino] imidazole-4-carboxamide isomerase/N-(5'phosphoribosyl)anthranilate isomerase
VAFTLLPAVDITKGHGDPRGDAQAWQAAGAAWIHLVDLDAAFGRGSNAELVAAIVGELDVEVQLAGGIRDDASLAWALSTGCSRVVVGTAALEDPAWCGRVIAAHGDRVAVGLDVRVIDGQHRLVARGGTRDVGELGATLARLDGDGCARYVVTDVGTDGTLGGPNIELYRAVRRATMVPVIASGGIGTIEDLVALRAGASVQGAIVGAALAAGRFTLREALAAVGET